ncbi:hypothetical protein GW17_00056950 [Ensete ventricosum]|nr:hypothetical protein GW17_00056950 [Ensete ventricosum]
MSQERQELLGNSREPPGEGTHIPNLSLTLGDLFLFHPPWMGTLLPKPQPDTGDCSMTQGSRPLVGNETAGHLPRSFPWTCAAGLAIDGNDPDYYPSHSSSMLCPLACPTDPSDVGLAPNDGPASSTFGTPNASSSISS